MPRSTFMVNEVHDSSGLARKLGLKAGQRVCLLGAPQQVAGEIHRQAPGGVVFSDRLDELPYDVILFWPVELPALAERFRQLQRAILPEGAIWAVMPKKKYARARGVDFSWEAIQAAGLETDLVDNKVASITEQEYGTRFVIRKERRGQYQLPKGK